MFYLVNDAGKFVLGFIEEGSPALMIYEGSKEKGVGSKKEMLCSSSDEAWQNLCRIVARFNGEGYTKTVYQGIDNFIMPDKLHFGVFPSEHTGVHVRFSQMDDVQFAAGVKRLTAVHAALKTKSGVKLKLSETTIEMSSKGAMFRVSKLSPAEWEAMPSRAKEIFSDRKFIDTKVLLPNGEGQWWIGTQESVLDLYLRAFLGEVWNAGARFTVSGGDAWQFDPKKPFDTAAVDTLQWYKNDPSLIQKLEKAGLLGGVQLSVAPTPMKTGFAFFL